MNLQTHLRLLLNATVLLLGLETLPVWAKYDGRVAVSAHHTPAPNSKRYRSAAVCVDKIQRHWPSNAQLVLNKRADIEVHDGDQILIVSGTVWRNGDRQQVVHECMLIPEKRSASLAGVVLLEQKVAQR